MSNAGGSGRDMPELSALLKFVDEGYALRSSVLQQQQQHEQVKEQPGEQQPGEPQASTSKQRDHDGHQESPAHNPDAIKSLSDDLKQVLDQIVCCPESFGAFPAILMA